VVGAWLQRRLTLAQAALAGLWSTAFVFPVMALGPNLAVLALAGALLFMVSPAYDIAQFSYRMARIPDALQGRVNSLYRMIMWGGEPVGRLATGALLQAFGPRLTLGVMAVGAGLIAVAAAANGELRKSKR
jgi:predicted MFS family arabinose efflux permease